MLIRPLVNRDEDKLIYIGQSALGSGTANAWFSVPEIAEIRSRAKTLSSFGDFSVIGFTLVGLGEPRSVQAGVGGGSYFQVMGLRPVLGRLLDAHDDGPNAPGAVVLTYRFWSTTLKSDPNVLGKAVRLGSFVDSRPATVVGLAGVLAFSVSGRTPEFGIRLAVGSEPRHLLIRVIAEGAAIAIGGPAVGLATGFGLARLAGTLPGGLKMPGALPAAGSALVLLLAAVIASFIPAARAARVDVMQALRSE